MEPGYGVVMNGLGRASKTIPEPGDDDDHGGATQGGGAVLQGAENEGGVVITTTEESGGGSTTARRGTIRMNVANCTNLRNDRRRLPVEGADGDEKDDDDSGGAGSTISVLEWKQLMTKKSNERARINSKMKMFKKPKKGKGAKSGCGKIHKINDGTVSSQLLMSNYFLREARGTPGGVMEPNNAK